MGSYVRKVDWDRLWRSYTKALNRLLNRATEGCGLRMRHREISLQEGECGSSERYRLVKGKGRQEIWRPEMGE